MRMNVALLDQNILDFENPNPRLERREKRVKQVT